MSLARDRRLVPVGTLAVLLALAACSSIGGPLAGAKNPPDETRVVVNEPLSMPPEFELRPPRDGGRETESAVLRERSEQAVFRLEDGPGQDGTVTEVPASIADNESLSPGERALLTRVGVQDTVNELRRIIRADGRARENSEGGGLLETTLNTLMFWRSSDEPEPLPSDTALDAEREAEREAERLGE